LANSLLNSSKPLPTARSLSNRPESLPCQQRDLFLLLRALLFHALLRALLFRALLLHGLLFRWPKYI